MRITYTVTSLDTADAWDDLAPALGDGHPFAVQSTIRHLRILGAKSYVLEEPYIDRDYSGRLPAFLRPNVPSACASLQARTLLLRGSLATAPPVPVD